MATGNGDPLELRVEMSSDEARAFLEKLTDEDFYLEFQKDPAAVLEREKVTIPRQAVLPDKIEVPERSEIEEFLKSGLPPIPPRPRPPYLSCIIWAVLYAVASRTESR